MANINNIIQEINTKLPDNNTQSITAKKLRDTLVDTVYNTTEEYDITVNTSNTKYASLSVALGTNGGNVPANIRKGGMTIRFVNSSTNKYEHYRYLVSSITDANFVNINNWQGIDVVPTTGSNNLVKSGGVKSAIDYAYDNSVGIRVQSFTNPQKAQARTNIGAASQAALDNTNIEVAKKANQTDLNSTNQEVNTLKEKQVNIFNYIGTNLVLPINGAYNYYYNERETEYPGQNRKVNIAVVALPIDDEDGHIEESGYDYDNFYILYDNLNQKINIWYSNGEYYDTYTEKDGRGSGNYRNSQNQQLPYSVLRALNIGNVSVMGGNNFSDAQKAQARTNIGAASQAALDNTNIEVAKKANQDGFYETMGVGTAINLAGQQDRSNPDKFRTSGGTEDIASGTARIESIKGNAIAWNQLIQNGDFSNGTEGWVSSSGHQLSVMDGVLQVTLVGTVTAAHRLQQGDITILANHKYLVYANVKPSNNTTMAVYCGSYFLNTPTIPNEWNYLIGIFVPTADRTDIGFAYSRNTTLVDGDTILYKNIMLFDLTLIYGEGYEPSTPKQFEADYKRWFGKDLTYEDYDAGTLKPVLMTGYKTVGFNLLDPTTGKAHLVGTYGNTNVAQGLYCYEITGNYTAITDAAGNAITPVNGFFIVENPQEITVTGANKNTCIHLTWSGWRNGETEAYWSDLSSIPVTTLTGKLNGTGESVVVFPDGMKSAGSVYDEIKIENGVVKAVKRIGVVDMGDMAGRWRMFITSSGVTVFYNYTTGIIKTDAKVLCTKYSYSLNLVNKVFNTRYYKANNSINIVDNDYDNETDLKNSLSGVTLYYELATPEEYILDNFELPIRFKVDDFGTEEQIGEGVASILTLKYGVNAVDALRRLPQNYISVESMDKFLAQLGVAMNGTWSRTWNESNQEYDFTFVPNSEPTPEPENTTNQEEE